MGGSARDYVLMLALPEAGPSFETKAFEFSDQQEAVVVGAQLAEFTVAVPAEVRGAIADSILLAQLAANKAAGESQDVFRWYDKEDRQGQPCRASRPKAIIAITSPLTCNTIGSSVYQPIRGRPWGPSRTAPSVDENTGRISGGGVAVHDDVGVAALLEVRIEDRFAGCAPAHLPLQQ